MPLKDVSVTLGDLASDTGGQVLQPYGSNIKNIGDMAAATQEVLIFTISALTETHIGHYTGEILISSSNAGSISVPIDIVIDDNSADVTDDGRVDLEDMAGVAKQWLMDGHIAEDVNGDGNVNILDVQKIAEWWLWEAKWVEE